MRSAAKTLRHALRKLGRSPLFTVVAALTLAVGIGAVTAVFSVVHGVLLKPLPFEEPERLVGVWHTAPGLGWDRVNQSPALYFTYREESRSFEESGMWDNGQVAVTGLEEPEQVAAMRVTDGTLPLLGVQPQLGRLFTAEDDTPGTQETVILSHGYWHRRLGGDPGAIGRTLVVDGTPREVIGVLPEGLRFLDHDPGLYLPFRFDRAEVFFGNFSYQGVARLRPGVSLEQANAEVERMIPMALDRFPMPEGFTRAMVDEVQFGPRVRPLKEDVVGDVGNVLWVLLGTVGIVLLVASANVANLFLVRAESRQQEVAVRSAIGASRARITRELLVESTLLGMAGGAAGLGLAWIGLELLRTLSPRGLPRVGEIGIDPVVLFFALGVSLLAALAAGAFPVLKLRTADLVGALKEGGRGASSGRDRHRLRNGLVVAQVAAALVLLVGSVLMIRTFQALGKVDPGFRDPGEVLTLRLAIPGAEVEEAGEVARIYERIYRELERLPGVASVGLSSSITMDGWDSSDPIFVEEFPMGEDQIPPLRRLKWIAPGYFETMGNPLLAGRSLTWADVHDRARVALVTESFAEKYWPSPADAVGKRIRVNPANPWCQIVGVVGDVLDDGAEEGPIDVVFWPQVMTDFWDNEVFTPNSMAFAVRSPRVGTPGFLDEVRNAVWSVRANLPLASVRTLEEIFDRSMARTSFTLVMLGIAATTALLLGSVGIYGVTSYAVSQRTREIGVRMALGARRRDVGRLVVRHGFVLAALGIVIGLPLAAALTRLMTSLLFEVSPVDPVTFVVVGVAVGLVALVASYLPARKAAGLDPAETLRW